MLHYLPDLLFRSCFECTASFYQSPSWSRTKPWWQSNKV